MPEARGFARDYAELRDIRASCPGRVAGVLAARERRPLLPTAGGRLLLVAADHPARGALRVGPDPLAMADRFDLLDRLRTALAHPGVDGVLATPDIIDDLALLGALEGKIAAGSLNRGGLAGASFEADDPLTAYTVEAVVAGQLDMAKILVRVALEDPATTRTLTAGAAAVTAAAAAQLPILIEPFLSRWEGGALVNDLSTEAIMRSVAIASGLGASSAYTWLKLPVAADMDRVMAATTLPTLLLGGDPHTHPTTEATWARALAAPGVRGLVVGRALLYPTHGDVTAATDAAATLVHG